MSLEQLERDLAAARAEVERVREALTPSGATKAAYCGEFTFNVGIGIDAGGTDRRMDVAVPWTVIKEIMSAIAMRAALEVRP